MRKALRLTAKRAIRAPNWMPTVFQSTRNWSGGTTSRPSGVRAKKSSRTWPAWGADEHAGAEADDDHGDLLDRDQAEDLADAHADALTDGELDAPGLGGDGHQHDQAE